MGDNAAIIEGLYDAFARGDVPAVLGAFDPKIEWNEAEHFTWWPGGPFIGTDAVIEGVFARIPAEYGDTFRVEVERIVDGGSTVFVQARYKGTVLATGNDIDLQAAHVWDVADGKVVRFQQYVDTWAAEKATGQAPVTV